MKKILNDEMKKITGGVYYPPPSSSCSIMCADGTTGTQDCGDGVDCVASPDSDSVFCGSQEYCVCDGHDIPKS